MPIVNFKFKCSLDVDTITFDELFISIRDVIEIIKQRKKISGNNDLQLINELTNETYIDEKALISNGTNLLVTRIPSKSQNRSKDKHNSNCGKSNHVMAKVDINAPLLAHVTDFSNYEASEEDIMQAIIYQSTIMYSPINYVNSNGLNQVGPVPPSYRCNKCYKKGHWIKDCPYNSKKCDKPRRSTGIPRSQLVTVEDPQVKGALMTENGSFAVTLLDYHTQTEQNKKRTNNESTETPKEEPIGISTNEVAADNFSKICYIPLTRSEKVAALGIVKRNLQDIPILKKSTLPLLTSDYAKVPCTPDGFPFIDFSKPPPHISSNFHSISQPRISPTDIDEMEVFLNDLRKKDEEDREKQKRQMHKYRLCSRSRSKSSSPPRSSSSRCRMESPKDSTGAIQTIRHRSNKSQARDSVTPHRRSDSIKFNVSVLQHSFRELRHRERSYAR